MLQCTYVRSRANKEADIQGIVAFRIPSTLPLAARLHDPSTFG